MNIFYGKNNIYNVRRQVGKLFAMYMTGKLNYLMQKEFFKINKIEKILSHTIKKM